MPENVEIEVFNIGRTTVDTDQVRRWFDRINVGDDFDLYPSKVSDPAFLVALAGKRCYMSFEPGLNPNVTKVRNDYVAYFDNILSSGHGSVLEHAVYSYAMEGVSRVFTAEMNRHRAGWAISEGSMRFIRFDQNIPYWLPNSIVENPADDPDLARRKQETRDIFYNVFALTEMQYKKLLDIWNMEEGDNNFAYKKKVTSCLRRIVPMGVATGGIWTGNIRALRHVMALRTEPAAEEEIAHVFGLVARDIIRREPLLFSDFESTNGQFLPKYRKV